MLRPLKHKDRQVGEPVAYNWAEPLTYHHMDMMDYWRVCIDEIVAVTWRPYMGLGP